MCARSSDKRGRWTAHVRCHGNSVPYSPSHRDGAGPLPRPVLGPSARRIPYLGGSIPQQPLTPSLPRAPRPNPHASPSPAPRPPPGTCTRCPQSEPGSPALLTKPHSSQRPPFRRAERPRPSAASRTRAGDRSPADWLARGPHASTTHDRDLKASDWRSVICSSPLIDCCPPVTFFSTLSHQLALVEASVISNWCSSVAPSPDWLP